ALAEVHRLRQIHDQPVRAGSVDAAYAFDAYDAGGSLARTGLPRATPAIFSPSTSKVTVPFTTWATFPSSLLLLPMNSAAKQVAGSLYSSVGEASCAIVPASRRTMRSASAIAST